MMLISFTYTVLLIKHPFWITGRKGRQFAALFRNDETEYSEKALYIFNILFIACRKFGAPYIGKAITEAMAVLSINESIILYFRQ